MKLFSLIQIIVCLFAWTALPVMAAIEEYAFDTDQQEGRFKKLTYELRCPKCLNSNLAGSDAPIAADLRAEIYDQIREGRTNNEIIEFMSSRYGDFILYRPRLTFATFFLWFGPAFLLLAGLIIARRMIANSQQAEVENDAPLNPSEQALLRKLLDDGRDQ
jgi:cytochrome c-type biogenesis protein CcmH